MPWRGTFSTGLPRRQPAARPSQAPWTRSNGSCSAGITGRAGGSDQRLRIPSRPSGSALAGSGMAASSSSRRPASCRSSRLAVRLEIPPPGGSRVPPAAVQAAAIARTSLPSAADWTSSSCRRSSGCTQVSRTPAFHYELFEGRLSGPPAPLVLGEDLPGHRRHDPAGRLDVPAAGAGDALTPLCRHRVDAVQRSREGTRHRCDRISVASIVDRAEHRIAVVPARDDEEPQRDRQLLDRVKPAGPASSKVWIPVIGTNAVERLHGFSEGADCIAPIAEAGRPSADGLYRLPRPVPGDTQCSFDD